MKRARISSPDFNVMGSTSLGIIEARIVYIELLEGPTMNTNPEVIQYVNIQKNENIHLGDEVIDPDRFGRYLRCKVKFNKEGVFNFKVKLIPDRGNSWYSPTEIERNADFAYRDRSIDFVTNEDGERIIEFHELLISPAGGDIFAITAKDAYGNEVQASAKVKNERLLYYIEIKMEGLGNRIPLNLDTVKNEYAKHNITLKELPPLTISHVPNIDCENATPFVDFVKDKYRQSQNSARDPYTMTLVYVDQLAVQSEGVLKYRDTEKNMGHITLSTYDHNKRTYNFLWKDVDDRGWFVECYYTVNDDPTHTKTHIARRRCTAVKISPNHTGEGMYTEVDIDVSMLPEDKKCEVTLTVKWIDGFCGGFSIRDANIIAISTRRMWDIFTPDEELQGIIIHEIGHQIGMVPNGLNNITNKSKLDRSPFFYDHTHFGHHCYRPDVCVMYGTVRSTFTFCPICAEAIKRMDLSNGVEGI